MHKVKKAGVKKKGKTYCIKKIYYLFKKKYIRNKREYFRCKKEAKAFEKLSVFFLKKINYSLVKRLENEGLE